MDVFIVGRILGKEILGVYSIALHLASLPMQRVNGIINQVTVPAFASIQTDLNLIKNYALKTCRLINFIAFPVFWGISCIAPEIVMVLLGDKWIEAIKPLILIPLIMPFIMTYYMIGMILTSIGKPHITVLNMFFQLIIMAVGFLVGVNFGIIGVSYVWIICFPAVIILMQVRAFPVLNINFFEFYKSATLKPLLIAGIMYIAVILLKKSNIFIANEIMEFIVLILTGILSYSILSFKFQKDTILELRGLLKK